VVHDILPAAPVVGGRGERARAVLLPRVAVARSRRRRCD